VTGPTHSARPGPVTVCEIRGQGRIMQCVRPGDPADPASWPAHVPEAERAQEKRCTACDHMRRMGELERIIGEWERRLGGA
jgi:hypothetical protein